MAEVGVGQYLSSTDRKRDPALLEKGEVRTEQI